MKIPLPKSKLERRREQNSRDWHLWFAWYPVRDSGERRLLWLERVARHSTAHNIDPVRWEYMTVAEFTKQKLLRKQADEAQDVPLRRRSAIINGSMLAQYPNQ